MNPVTQAAVTVADHLASDAALKISGPLVHTADCAAQHFAPWAIEEHWFRQAVEAVKSGAMQPRADNGNSDSEESAAYSVYNGVAVISITGAIMKKRSKYGGTSSVETRVLVRKAANDASIKAILLHIDSPGGTVAGTADLAADVKAANAVKPVYAYIEDCGASAAYWIASQAREIRSNATAFVGSIGTLLVLYDTSGQYAADGVKVYVVSTGKYKGAGVDGAEITKDQLAMFQGEVDDVNEHFIAGVADGRGMTVEEVRALADGRCHIASKALGLGLIDAIGTTQEFLTDILANEITNLESGDDNMPDVPDLPLDDPPDCSIPKDTNHSSALVEPQRSDPPPQTFLQEPSMATDNVTAPPAQTPAAGGNAAVTQQDNQIASLNSQAIQGYIERGRAQGYQEGIQAEQKRMRDITAAAPGRPEIAVNAFLAGQNASTVALIADAAQSVEIRNREAMQAKEVEIARLNALVATGGHPGVNINPASANTGPGVSIPQGLDAQSQAKLEWDSDPNVRAKANNNEKAWMLYRVNQLNGNVRAFSRVA